jgi:hypothetical protein
MILMCVVNFLLKFPPGTTVDAKIIPLRDRCGTILRFKPMLSLESLCNDVS